MWRELIGPPPWKQLAQQLTDIWNEPNLERELRAYLKATPAQFLSLAHFRRGFGRWDLRRYTPVVRYEPDRTPGQPLDVHKLRALVQP